jgi:LysR family glycine cleavage system transcriptional activator
MPRLQDFQRQHPEVDIRVSATDAIADPDDPEIDFALRYCHADEAPPGSTPLFGEVLTPVVSPTLAATLPRRWRPADLAAQTLLEEDDQRPSAEYLSWRHWLAPARAAGLEPRGWIYLNFTYQQIQAALAGQGVALARVALVHETLARGELVEPFGAAGAGALAVRLLARALAGPAPSGPNCGLRGLAAASRRPRPGVRSTAGQTRGGNGRPAALNSDASRFDHA